MTWKRSELTTIITNKLHIQTMRTTMLKMISICNFRMKRHQLLKRSFPKWWMRTNFRTWRFFLVCPKMKLMRWLSCKRSNIRRLLIAPFSSEIARSWKNWATNNSRIRPWTLKRLYTKKWKRTLMWPNSTLATPLISLYPMQPTPEQKTKESCLVMRQKKFRKIRWKRGRSRSKEKKTSSSWFKKKMIVKWINIKIIKKNRMNKTK